MPDKAKSAAAIEAAILRRIDEALRAEIQEHGPVLLWSGEGDFPRYECKFRGLSVGAGRHAGRLGGLAYWLGVKPTEEHHE